MLSKFKMPLSSIANAILAMDSSALNIDQVESLIKFCPTEEEMEIVKNYNGDKEMLGKCEKLFLELMKVPQVESKLRAFAYTINFTSEVEDLKLKMNALNNFATEIRGCTKLRFILKTLVSLGNQVNRGKTGSKMVGQSIKLKHIEPSTPERTAFMYHIRTILAQEKPELLEFSKDLAHLRPASKIELKEVADYTSDFHKGFTKLKDVVARAKNDGDVSSGFHKVYMSFVDKAEVEMNLLITLHNELGRNVDSLTMYFLNDPARYSFERVIRVFLDITNILGR